MDRLILGLVIGALAGIAAGFGAAALLGGDDAALGDGGSGGTGDAPREAAHTDDDVRQPSRARDEPASPGETAVRAEFDAAVRAIPLPEVASGDLAIAGHVIDTDGVPMAGVEIIAESNEYWRTRRHRSVNDDPHRPVEDVIAAAVERIRWTRSTRRIVTTDGEGGFRLADLAPGRYRIQPRMEGYRFTTGRNLQLFSVRAPASIEITAEGVSGLVLDVRLPDGSEPRSARVRLEGDHESLMTWQALQPRLELRPGDYHVEVTAENGRFKAKPFDVKILERAPDVTLDVSLVGRPSIHGSVDARGETRDFLRVFALPVDGSTPPDPSVMAGSKHEDWASGRDRYDFEITDVLDGRYAVAGVENERFVTDVVFVDVQGDVAECKLTLKELDPADHLIIHAFAPDGERVDGIDATLTVEYAGGSSSGGGGRVVRRADGSFWQPFPESEYDDAKYSVTVKNEKYGSATVEFVRTRRTEVTVNFAEPATLDVTVAGYVGGRLEGRIDVYARRSGRRRSWARNERVISPGKWRFGPIQPGEHVVGISPSRRRGPSSTLLEETVNVEAGENAVTLSLPRVHDFIVAIPGAGAGVHLTLSPVGAGGRNASRHERSNSDGKVEFTMVPAGRYRLQSFRGVPKTMVIDVPCGPEIAFEGREPDCLEVEIRDEKGALARAGFENGDLVIGLDGEEFGAGQKLMMALVKLRGAATAEMIVARRGRRFTLTIKPEALMGGDAGGNLSPANR